MPVLFDIVEETKIDDNLTYRLLNRGDDWGVDDTLTMNPVFGYSEKGARNTYKRLVELSLEKRKK